MCALQLGRLKYSSDDGVRLQSATVKHCRWVITLIYRGEIEILVCPRLHLFHCLLKWHGKQSLFLGNSII